MTKQRATWSSQLLPPDAVARLQKAAKTRPTPGDPLARVKALEQAHRAIKSQYPNYFRKDD